jgi:hypothetical protein
MREVEWPDPPMGTSAAVGAHRSIVAALVGRQLGAYDGAVVTCAPQPRHALAFRLTRPVLHTACWLVLHGDPTGSSSFKLG